MFRMNGQDFCSRQILSTYIHVGSDAVPGMAKSGDVQDERSGFLLQANPKYLHPCRQ